MKTLGLWKDVDDEVDPRPPAPAALEDHLGATRLTVAERSRAVAQKARGELMEGYVSQGRAQEGYVSQGRSSGGVRELGESSWKGT